MKKILFLTVLLFNCFTNAQNVMCDSIMKQMDIEIKNAKANGYDASILKQLEDTKTMLQKMYCENGVIIVVEMVMEIHKKIRIQAITRQFRN